MTVVALSLLSHSLKVVVMVAVLLLLLCGDVETNPGPDGEYIKRCIVKKNWNEDITLPIFVLFYHYHSIPFLILQGTS